MTQENKISNRLACIFKRSFRSVAVRCGRFSHLRTSVKLTSESTSFAEDFWYMNGNRPTTRRKSSTRGGPHVGQLRVVRDAGQTFRRHVHQGAARGQVDGLTVATPSTARLT
uniref:Uncharacterized protein n=1 Tax=Sipha flava TaxID=143950 RepID=A0A2S2QGX9_9HEMI